MTGIVKRSLTIHGHRTSISLEKAFLDELRAIATRRDMSFAALVEEIDDAREQTTNLSSALRLHVLDDLKLRG